MSQHTQLCIKDEGLEDTFSLCEGCQNSIHWLLTVICNNLHKFKEYLIHHGVLSEQYVCENCGGRVWWLAQEVVSLSELISRRKQRKKACGFAVSIVKLILWFWKLLIFNIKCYKGLDEKG